MTVRERDRLGYYHVLNVSPDADAEEIELAYAVLRQMHEQDEDSVDTGKVRAAYRMLITPDRRQAYDPGYGRAARGGKMTVQLPTVLLILVGVLVVTLAYSLGPTIMVALTSFDPGEDLVWSDTGQPLGTVQEYESEHLFPNGARAAAYLIDVGPGSPGVWYPAGDLARLAEGH